MKTIFNSPAMNLYSNNFISYIGPESDKPEPGFSYSSIKPDSIDGQSDILYSFNEHGFRSDNFDKSFAPDNFLFAGCALTFGLGVPKDITWPYLFTSKITNSENFNIFNLSVIDGSIDLIVYNVVQYIENFGNPKGILILFPDFFRNIYVEDEQILSNWNIEEKREDLKDIADTNMLRSFFAIKQLEVICDSKNIPLVYSSWQYGTVEMLMGLKEQGMLKHVFDIKQFYRDNRDMFTEDGSKYPHYWHFSRDNTAFGESHNRVFAEGFVQQWKTINDAK